MAAADLSDRKLSVDAGRLGLSETGSDSNDRCGNTASWFWSDPPPDLSLPFD